MEHVIAHNSGRNRHRIFKLGGMVDHVTRHVCSRSKGQRSRSRNICCNSAVGSHIIFKLGGNYHHGDQVSRSNKPEVEIWWTFSIQNAQIKGKHPQIVEILHCIRKLGSGNPMVMSENLPEFYIQPVSAHVWWQCCWKSQFTWPSAQFLKFSTVNQRWQERLWYDY